MLRKFLTNNSWLQVNKDGPGDILPSSSLTEKGCERVIIASTGLAAGHVAIGLDSMLQAVQLPAGVAHLDTGLANVNRDALTLWKRS